jgi:hypothetical protein
MMKGETGPFSPVKRFACCRLSYFAVLRARGETLMDDGNAPGAGAAESGIEKALIEALEDDIPRAVQPDSHSPAQYVAVTGYLGSGSSGQHYRLYLTADMNEYIEFETNAVGAVKSLHADGKPMGGTVVWLHADAGVTYARVMAASSLRQQASFTRGSIASAVMPQLGVVNPMSGGVYVNPNSGAGCSTMPLCEG